MRNGAVWLRKGSPFLVCMVYTSVGLCMCAHVCEGFKLTENNLHCFPSYSWRQALSIKPRAH